MANVTNKSVYPPPPAFYQLYTQPPPPPPGGVSEAAAGAEPNAPPPPPPLPIDLYTPPPPLQEPFLKFGELHPPGFYTHELPPDVPPLYVVRQEQQAESAAAASSDSSAASSAASAASSVDASLAPLLSPYPSGVDYCLSLRLLNRQYLASYLSLLGALVPAPSSASASASAAAADAPRPPEESPSAVVEAHLKDLSQISANYSMMLTKLRPYQANQTMIQIMMKQIARRKEKKAEIERCIADAREFLASHGVHFEEGSSNIEPTGGMPPSLIAGAGSEGVKKEEASAMQIDSAQSDAKPAGLRADPLAQLRAFLDALPDDDGGAR